MNRSRIGGTGPEQPQNRLKAAQIRQIFPPAATNLSNPDRRNRFGTCVEQVRDRCRTGATGPRQLRNRPETPKTRAQPTRREIPRRPKHTLKRPQFHHLIQHVPNESCRQNRWKRSGTGPTHAEQVRNRSRTGRTGSTGPGTAKKRTKKYHAPEKKELRMEKNRPRRK